MPRRRITFLILFVALVFHANSFRVLAQTQDEQFKPEIERFKPNSRAIGFGGSLVVQARDPSAIFWNPALLTSLRGRAMLISINEPFGFDFVGLSQFIPLYGTVGVALSRVSTAGETVDKGTLAWGRRFATKLAIGANVNVEKFGDDWFVDGTAGLFVGNPKVGSLDYRWREHHAAGIFDRLSFGFTAKNIPFSSKLLEPSAQLGLSYLIPGLGVLFNAGYHVVKGENTTHLGLGFELNQSIRIFSGLEDLDFDKWGVGMGYTHDNFIFSFTYSTELTRILFSLTARISPAPEVLAKPYYDKAFENLNSKNHKAASHEFRKYLSFDLRSSKTDTARHLVRYLEKKLARDQMMVDSLLTVTSKLLGQGEKQYLRAALILSKILELDPDNLKARSKLATLNPHVDKFVKRSLADGIFEFQTGKYFEAKKSFNRVLLFDKENKTTQNYLTRIDRILKDLGEEYFYRGVGYFRQKNYVSAKGEFVRALKYNPDLREARSYLDRTVRQLQETNQKIAALIQQGKALEKKKQYVDATNKYLEVLKLDENNSFVKSRIKVLRPKVDRYVQSQYNKGLKHYRNEAYLEAQEAFSTVLSIDPNHTAARRRLRDLRQEKKEKASLYLKQADEAFQKRQWQTALDMYSNVINLDPGNSLAVERIQETKKKMQIDDRLNQARAHLKSENYKEAVEDYENVLQLDPDNETAKAELDSTRKTIDELVEKYFNDGISLYTLDRYQEAIEMWNKALVLKPDHESSLTYKQQALERIEALKKMK